MVLRHQYTISKNRVWPRVAKQTAITTREFAPAAGWCLVDEDLARRNHEFDGFYPATALDTPNLVW
jgi:hypothetical protein